MKGRRDFVHSNDQIMPVRALAITVQYNFEELGGELGMCWLPMAWGGEGEAGEGGAARLRAQIMQANTQNGHTQEDGPRDQLMQG